MVLLCARTLCHVPDAQAAFAEFARITARGGALIVTDLDPSFREPVTRLPTANGKIDVPTFRRSPDELVGIRRRFGFEPRERYDFPCRGDDEFFVLRMSRAA